MLNAGEVKGLVLDLLADSPLIRESVIEDVQMLVRVGEEEIAFDTMCSWLFEDDLAITHEYHDRLIAAAQELHTSEAIRRLDELVRTSDSFEHELTRHDWPALDSFGQAADLPGALRALAAARDDTAAAATVNERIDGIAFSDGYSSPAAVAVTSVLARTLEAFSPAALPHALKLLAQIAACEELDPEQPGQGPHPDRQCIEQAATVFDRYCELLCSSNDVPTLHACIDIVTICGTELAPFHDRAMTELTAALGRPSLEQCRDLLTNSIASLRHAPGS
jgi:hypothetical protein